MTPQISPNRHTGRAPVPQSFSTSQALLDSVLAVVRQQVLAEIQQESPKPATMKRLLTVAEAGEFLGRTETAIRQLIFKKLIPVVRFGRNIRIDVRDLEAIIVEYRM